MQAQRDEKKKRKTIKKKKQGEKKGNPRSRGQEVDASERPLGQRTGIVGTVAQAGSREARRHGWRSLDLNLDHRVACVTVYFLDRGTGPREG